VQRAVLYPVPTLIGCASGAWNPVVGLQGDRVRRHLLEPGGGSDPWKMVTGLLGYQPAVKDIASWLAARVHQPGWAVRTHAPQQIWPWMW